MPGKNYEYLLSNPKRFAIRHTPSITYQTLFARDLSAPVKEQKLARLEGTIRVDPRKPTLVKRRRSLTLIPKQRTGAPKPGTQPALHTEKINSSRKRRSSLPLEAKLNLIGIEVPPVTLEILLYEPNKEVRSVGLSLI